MHRFRSGRMIIEGRNSQGASTMTTDTTPLVFNPFDVEFRKDPYPTYRRLREEQPAHYSELAGIHVLTKHADCTALLRHPAASSDQTKGEGWRDGVIAQGLDPDELLANRTRPVSVHGPAGPHAAARPGEQGIHAARRRGDAAAGAGDRR